MTTPAPPDFTADATAGSRLLGTNGLQAVVDKLTQAVDKLASVASQMGSPGPAGTTTSTFGSTGQTFTRGSFPRMAPAAAHFSGGSYATAPMTMGGAMSNPAGTLSAAGGQFGNQVQTAFNGGGPRFSNQILMNQFAAMSVNAMNPGNMGQQMGAMYNQAFGSYGRNVNAIALGAADAAQGYSTLQQIAGSPYVNSTALGRAAFSGYSALGIANPSLGAGGSAAAMAQLYSPQTSMLMRMYGYRATPRALGGIGNPLQGGQLAQSLFQRWYGSSSVNMNTLNAGLANGGKVGINLQALGLDPSTYGPMLQMYNKLFQQGVSANQANAMLTAAGKNQQYGGQSAQRLLSNKYGISTSDLQKFKNQTATQTSNTAGEMGGFDSAVSMFSTAVNQFDKIIGALMKKTGLGSIAGFMGGASGTMGSSGIGGLFSMGMGVLSGIFGGGVGGSGGAGGGSSSGGQGTPGSSTTSTSRQVSTAIKDAESMLGKPYVWGGSSPATGFDCSGLIEWAYAQAGIKLPRTSSGQWAALQNRSVPLNKVRAGDIVFAAGSDGTFASPGHEAMMISNNQIIESPYTGANIRIRAFNPGEWQHAGRPSGSLSGGGGSPGGPGSPNGTGTPSTTTGRGNAGLGLSVGNYGSSNEVQNIAAALLGSSMTGYTGSGMGSVGNGQGSGSAPNGVSSTGGSLSPAAIQRLWNSLGGPPGAAANMARIAFAESGDRPGAVQQGQSPGNTGWGLYQITPTSGIRQNGQFGNLLDASNNTRAAISLYKSSGYRPWRSDAVGASLAGYADGTGWAQAGIALVGERGPELIRLSGGQQIMDANKTANILKGQAARPPGSNPWSAGTAASLVLAAVPQNSYSRAMGGGKCEVHLNMPPNAINIHTQGNATDVSNSVRQIMDGISSAMAENETVRQIMEGVMG